MSKITVENGYTIGQGTLPPVPTDPNLWVIHTNGGYTTTDSFMGYILMLYFQNMILVGIVALIGLSSGLYYWYH